MFSASNNIIRIAAKLIAAASIVAGSVMPAEAGLFKHCKRCKSGCEDSSCCGCGGGFIGGDAGWAVAGGPGFVGMAGPPMGPAAMPRPPLPTVPPPPGTLGRTYSRPSWPVPEDEHPRTAMVEVRGASHREVAVQGLKGYKAEDGVWHFETEKPLVPGSRPFIYEVRARTPGDTAGAGDLRVIRLIPGRVVTLDY